MFRACGFWGVLCVPATLNSSLTLLASAAAAASSSAARGTTRKTTYSHSMVAGGLEETS